MKFLLDQDVYPATARCLSDLGHDVVPVAQVGLSQADDEELLKVAQAQDSVNHESRVSAGSFTPERDPEKGSFVVY